MITSRPLSLQSITQSSHLDVSALSPYDYFTSQLFGADLGFHAEWLRDEP